MLTEDDTYRQLIRSNRDVLLQEIDKDCNIYGLGYAKEYLQLYRISVKHNWRFEDTVKVLVHRQCNNEIEAASNKLNELEEFLKEDSQADNADVKTAEDDDIF